MCKENISGQFEPVIDYIRKNLLPAGNLIAIDGRCASGKSTLASVLASEFDCNVFHMDDFFLHGAMRTPERLSLPGENVDHERFLSEVLLPASAGSPVQYRRYNCHLGDFEPTKLISPKPISIIEGVYSFHSSLEGFYTMKLFLDIAPALQRRRILVRNMPEQAERFFNEWIPMEENYFQTFAVRSKADFIFTAEE